MASNCDQRPVSGPYISLTLIEAWADRNRWKKVGEALTYGERRESVGETGGEIMVGELCLFEGHNYEIWVIGDN